MGIIKLKLDKASVRARETFQLLLDFDYSNVGVYEGDLLDEDVTPDHPALIGVWVLDEEGSAFVPAEEFRQGSTEVEN